MIRTPPLGLSSGEAAFGACASSSINKRNSLKGLDAVMNDMIVVVKEEIELISQLMI